MLYALLKTLHLLAALLWVGGMLFVQFFLRPALAVLPPPERLALMREVLRRFLAAVGLAVLLLLLSGFGMAGLAARAARAAGSSFSWPPGWIVMAALGHVMVAVFGHIRFMLFGRFTKALDAADRAAAAAVLNRIRIEVSVNLVLGLVIVAVAVLL